MSVCYQCNECGKIIEEHREPYYEIEVTRHVPQAESFRIVRESQLLQGGGRTVEVEEGAKAWTDWSLHFCRSCWKKLSMAKFYSEPEYKEP